MRSVSPRYIKENNSYCELRLVYLILYVRTIPELVVCVNKAQIQIGMALTGIETMR